MIHAYQVRYIVRRFDSIVHARNEETREETETTKQNLKRGWDAPKDGGEAPKEGSSRKKYCSFCGRVAHTIASCEQHKEMGDVIIELGKFRSELSDGRMVSQPLPPEAKSPFLESVPTETKWLVFHRHFQIVAGAPINNSTNRLAEVSFYGKAGIELQNDKGRHCVSVGGFCHWIGGQMQNNAGSRHKKNVFSTYEKETFQAVRVKAKV